MEFHARAAGTFPLAGWVHNQVLVALDVQHRFDEALAVYREAAKLENGRYQLHNNMGNILGILGRHAESLVEYREAIRLRPGEAFLHNAAGSELAALGFEYLLPLTIATDPLGP